MPRNDQIIRQWHILRELESSRGKTINELAQGLPSDYPKHARTIRRDMEALEAAGFPLITEHQDGVVKWKLMDGYGKVPALGFSHSELMALTLARRLLEPLEGTNIQASLQSAMAKAQVGIPDNTAGELANIQSALAFGLGSHKSYKAHRATINQLSQAITNMHTVQMRYFSASRNQTTRREVDPYRLWYTSGALYLVGYCHRRKDVRMFAVERIRSLTLTDHPFQMALGFNVNDYVQDALGVLRGRPIQVELRFEKNDRGLGEGPHLTCQSISHLTENRGNEHGANRGQ
ncbi:MAG: WYL domain-containing protein [Nitrospirae bacterium]|nr:WYL domain-containing protein [Nitrospirota bacterium]MDA1304673.1 WYL domain-containing protein [Nitrospirota bacterium]